MNTVMPMRNENGFVLVASLMVLLILVVVGIAAINTTNTELLIAGNERVARDNFYKAEAAAQEGAQELENENDKDDLIAKRSSHKWLFDNIQENSFESDAAQWQALLNDLASGLNSPGSNSISRIAMDHGIVKGDKASSLKMTASAVHEYHLLGRSTGNNSQKIIEIGYKKRF